MITAFTDPGESFITTILLPKTIITAIADTGQSVTTTIIPLIDLYQKDHPSHC